MNSNVPAKPQSFREDALTVLTRLRDAGHVAYFAGGCVRDLLLNIEPADYDIATDAPPDRVRSIFRNTQAVGAAFGVVLVRHHQSQIEVATFRADGDYLDGRRPQSVRFTSAEEDARRRDFTINGLFLDPISNEVIDYVGGRDDLKAGRLRAIGDPEARFTEDHLRLLRAVRFAARFAFTIDPATADAIRHHAGELRRVSPERIADELRRMLTPANTRQHAWQLLWELGLTAELFRHVQIACRVSVPRNVSLFPLVAAGVSIPFGLALATISFCYQWRWSDPSLDPRELLSVSAVQKIVRTFRQTLRISNDESELVSASLGDLHPLLADTAPTLAMKKRFLAKASSHESRVLMQAMAMLGIQPQRIAPLLEEFAALEQADVAPEPLLNGDHLLALGLAPSRTFKRVLDAVYDAQLESRITTAEQALELAQQLINSPN